MVKLGIAVILLSVVLFVAAMVAPQVITPLGFLYCPAGLTMTSETDTYSYRPGETDTTDYFYCVNSDGQQKSEVTSNVTLTLTGIYLVVLFIGIGLTIVGGNRQKRQVTAGWRQPINNNSGGSSRFRFNNGVTSDAPLRFSRTLANANVPDDSDVGFNAAGGSGSSASGGLTLDDLRDGTQNGTIRFGGQEVSIADLKSGAYQHQATADSKRTLADTLKQLNDAHTQGLINDDEYGHLRQEALDKLV